jgi:hypothetical protein
VLPHLWASSGSDTIFAPWDGHWARAADRLRTFSSRVSAVVAPYDPLLASRPAVEEISVRLTRAQRESLDLAVADEAVGWIGDNWPPPGEKVEAVFALWELGAGYSADSR